MIVVSLQLALAGILAVAAVGKFLDIPGSRQAVRDFGVPQRFANPLGTALPAVELALAILLLPGATARWAALGAALLFLAFIGGIAWNLRKGNQPDCHCFGQFHSAPAGWPTIIRNALFTAMAGVIGAGGLGNFALQYGYRQFNPWVTWAAVIIIIVIVQLVQLIGNTIARKLLRR